MSEWRINNGDFEEDDVWSVVKSHEDHSSHNMRSTPKDYIDDSYSSCHFSTTPRMIPRANYNHALSSLLISHDEVKIPQQSAAPVNIPDWSKIYGKNNGKMMMGDGSSSSWADVGHNHVNGGYGYNGGGEYHYGAGDYGNNDDNNYDNDDDDLEDDGGGGGLGGVIPPHEWIAKRLARTRISSFSVCEGAGRTLKGRDLSKLRNAILTKTGFLE